ncbi:MAG TPA: O-antigen ligase family protein [Chthoniobacterales bacterium]|nr:O-antigen ligase family protein [Chthoniobacterales bacterium]
MTLGLLVGAFVYLQVLISQREMLPVLVAYAFVAVAGLIAAAAQPSASPAPSSWCFVAAAVLCGYIVGRALTSPVSYVARADLYLVLAGFVVYAVVLTALSAPARRAAIFVTLLLVALVHVAVAVAQVIRGGSLSLLVPALQSFEQGEITGRGAGLYASPNHLAGMLELVGVLGLSLACWSRRPHWLRICIGYLAAACYVGVALTGSRGGYLGVAASILAFACLSLLVLGAAGGRHVLKFGAIALVIASLGGLGLWTLVQQNPTLSGKLQNIVTDPTRVTLWEAAIEQWKLQPWIGTGSGTYLFYGREFRAPTFQQDPVDVHNDYLHLLAEYGVAGAAAFLLFFLVHVGYGCRTFVALGIRRVAAGAPPLSDRLALNIGALSCLAAYLVHSAVDFNMHIPANALLIASIFGMLAAPGLTQDQTTLATVPRWTPRLGLTLAAAVLLIQCVRILPGEYFADRARIALWREDWEAAMNFGLEALKREKQNPHIYFYLGRALRASAGELSQWEERVPLYESALSAHTKAHRLSPLDATYLIDQAQLYDILGRFEEAERMFALAKARDPRAQYISDEYNAHQKLWRRSRTHSQPPAGERPPVGQ